MAALPPATLCPRGLLEDQVQRGAFEVVLGGAGQVGDTPTTASLCGQCHIGNDSSVSTQTPTVISIPGAIKQAPDKRTSLFEYLYQSALPTPICFLAFLKFFSPTIGLLWTREYRIYMPGGRVYFDKRLRRYRITGRAAHYVTCK